MSVRSLLYRLFGLRADFEMEQGDRQQTHAQAREVARQARHKAANLRQTTELQRAERAIRRDHAAEH